MAIETDGFNIKHDTQLLKQSLIQRNQKLEVQFNASFQNGLETTCQNMADRYPKHPIGIRRSITKVA